MLNDEVIDKVIERLVDRIEEANVYTLQRIGENIKRIRTLSPTDAHDLAQILKYGGDYDKIVKKLAEITDLNVKDIYEIFDEVAKNDYMFAKQFYDYRGVKFIPYEQNINLRRQVQAIATMTANEYFNLSRTLAFATRDRKGRVVYTELAKMYQNIIDEAVLSVAQGKSTFDQQMYNAIKQLGESGIRTVDYESGRSTRLDSAVRMNMKSSLRSLHNEIQQQVGKEFGADGVEISVHENPAPDHAEVQGRQFSNEEFEKFQNDEEAVSYDKVVFPPEHDGHDRRSISEYNCYHYIFSIVLGVSQPQYDSMQLKTINERNKDGFELDGKHYTMYEGTQMQRQLETKIREQKDLQILARASGNEQLVGETQQKITYYTQKYKELSNQSGLPTKNKRMRVSNYKRVNVSSYNAPKVAKADNVNLKNSLQYGNIVIPSGVELEDVRVIAGYQTSTGIKTIGKLAKDYPDLPQVWQKKVGTLKGKYDNYEIHWYQNGDQQFYHKIKPKRRKK